MAQTSGFFESVWDETLLNPDTQTLGDWDIKYYYDQFAEYFAKFFGNGVYYNPADTLQVLAAGGMTLQVKRGWAFINGFWYHLDEDTTLIVPGNSTAYTRTDSVMLRWSVTNRSITVVYVTDSVTPTRNSSIYDLVLAEIAVGSGVVAVTGTQITDRRFDSEVCGIVNGLQADVIDTDDLFSQYDAIFNEWFDGIKDQLVGDLGAKLQLEFTQLNQNVEEFETSVNQTVSGISQVANSTYETISAFTNRYFTLPLRVLNFNEEGVCVIVDSRVTSDSLVDVYYTSESIEYAENAVINIESGDGVITLTFENTPVGEIQAKIKVEN